MSLSHVLGSPNLSSKGALERRVISVQATLFPPRHHHHVPSDTTSTKKLIKERADCYAALMITVPKILGLGSA